VRRVRAVQAAVEEEARAEQRERVAWVWGGQAAAAGSGERGVRRVGRGAWTRSGPLEQAGPVLAPGGQPLARAGRASETSTAARHKCSRLSRARRAAQQRPRGSGGAAPAARAHRAASGAGRTEGRPRAGGRRGRWARRPEAGSSQWAAAQRRSAPRAPRRSRGRAPSVRAAACGCAPGVGGRRGLRPSPHAIRPSSAKTPGSTTSSRGCYSCSGGQGERSGPQESRLARENGINIVIEKCK
jgi:hypothetical protein